MVNGAWQSSTIKEYIRNTAVTDSSSKADYAKTIGEMMRLEISLEGVKKANEVASFLDGKGPDIEDLHLLTLRLATFVLKYQPAKHRLYKPYHPALPK